MNDEQFIKDLKVISTADCSHWLKELLKHQKEKPKMNEVPDGSHCDTSNQHPRDHWTHELSEESRQTHQKEKSQEEEEGSNLGRHQDINLSSPDFGGNKGTMLLIQKRCCYVY